MRKAFDKIAAGLNEAIAIARGEAEPAALYVSSELHVKAIRKATGLSQPDFARAYGFTMDQIRAWEQNCARPLGGVRAYFMMIGADPNGVAAMLREAVKKQAAYTRSDRGSNGSTAGVEDSEAAPVRLYWRFEPEP